MNIARPTFLCLFLFCLLASAAPCYGQDEDAGAQAVNRIQDASTGFVTTIQSAFGGDKAAMNTLLNDYVFPVAIAIILLIVGYMFASFLGSMVNRLATDRIDKTIGRFIGTAVKNVVLVLVVLCALGSLGVDITSFAAILAAVGFAVGMALKDTLGNVAAGFMLLVFRPFKIDEYIKVADVEGTVEEINLFTTRLNTADRRHIIIPNGKIFDETMINYSRNPRRRVDVTVGVSYDADLKKTRQVLQTAIANVPDTLQDPSPQVCLVELGDSAVVWSCRTWCPTDQYWSVREQLTEHIKISLDAARIGIPYPQMDVHVGGQVVTRAA